MDTQGLGRILEDAAHHARRALAAALQRMWSSPDRNLMASLLAASGVVLSLFVVVLELDVHRSADDQAQAQAQARGAVVAQAHSNGSE